MGKLYLGICEDTKRNGVWVQTLSTPEGDYNTLSGSIWRGLKARLKKPVEAYNQASLSFENFPSFVDWNRTQQGYGQSWHLDKDLLGDGFNYSPETCCLLPPDLNVLMQGVGSWKRGESVGASYFKRDGNWRAYGNDFYEQVHLGYHVSREEAHRAWRLDKANRIECYEKSNLPEKIVLELEKLVDSLRH